MFNQYPYLNLNDLNLDYLLNEIKSMYNDVTNFVSINAIKYADPIQWNITSQYEKNTVVIDPLTGTAYISVAAVPSGVALTREEYWTVVFDLGSFVTRAAQNFTSRWESDTTLTASFPTSAGQWLVWGDVLYKALTNITAGDSYVVDGNISRITVEEVKNAIIQLIGDLDELTTTDKSNLVAAINELSDQVSGKIGDLDTLTTLFKDDLVGAINEVNIKYYVTPEKYGAVGDGVTNDTVAFQAAVNSGLPVALIGDYLLDTITANNIRIIGNKRTIYNNGTERLFVATNIFKANDLTIVNKPVYSMARRDEGTIQNYATIYASLVALDNVTFTDTNQIDVYCNSCVVDNCRFYGKYDINNIYNGDLNNMYMGIYVHHDVNSDGHNISLVNSYFDTLVEGIYIGSYATATKITATIDNNTFKNMGDHAAYINTFEDQIVASISNNSCYQVTTAFAVTCQCNIENNLIVGGYVGIRQTYGLAIRNASNVRIVNNRFINENYTTSTGVSNAFYIISLQETITEINNIIFENNTFDISENNSSVRFFAFGSDAGYLTKLSNIKFINNKFNVTGFALGMRGNPMLTVEGLEILNNEISCDFLFIADDLNEAKTVIGNKVTCTASVAFDISANGLYENNTFDCPTIPIRFVNANGRLFVSNNVNNNANQTRVYNPPTQLPIITSDTSRGEFTGTLTTAVDELLLASFGKLIYVTDSNGNPETGTIELLGNGRANLTGFPSGTHKYVIF